MVVFFALDLSPTLVNTRATDETFQQSGKQDSFRHICKGLDGMYESLDSLFLRTTTEIQSGPDAFDNQGCLWPFLTNLGFEGLLCCFK